MNIDYGRIQLVCNNVDDLRDDCCDYIEKQVVRVRNYFQGQSVYIIIFAEKLT